MNPFLVLALTLCVPFLLKANDLPELPSKADFHLYIAAGQSNMAGFAETLANDAAAKPRIWVTRVRADGSGWDGWQVESVIAPEHIGTMGGIGPWLSFAETMADQESEVTIGIINVAVGGTSLQQWMEDGAMTDLALPIIRRAMQEGTLKGMIWHQGEAGTGKQSGDYAEMFRRMLSYYRTTLEAPDLPVVAGTIGRMGIGGEVNKALHEVADQDENLRIAVSSHRTLKDAVHYDNGTQRILGIRYADAMLTLQGRPRPLALLGPEQIQGTAYQYLSADYEIIGGDGSLPQWSYEGTLPPGIYQVGGWLSGILSGTTDEYFIMLTARQGENKATQAVKLEVLPSEFPLRLPPLLDFTATKWGKLENNRHLYAGSPASVLMVFGLPSGITIGEATLSIYVDAVPDEADTLTLALAELPESLSADSQGVEVRRIIETVEGVRSGTWIEWDVTALVQSVAPVENAIAFALGAPDLSRWHRVIVSSQRGDHPPVLTLQP